MKRIESSVIFGIALICVGVLFLLQNLGVLGVLTGLLWALLFACGGAAFLLAFVLRHGCRSRGSPGERRDW